MSERPRTPAPGVGCDTRAPMLLLQMSARVPPQSALSGRGPGEHILPAPLASWWQCWSPWQSALLLQLVEQVWVVRSQVPPQAHWVSA